MGKNILVAGKDLPESERFVESLVSAGNNVAVTYQNEASHLSLPEERAAQVKWNRASPVSARAIITETENSFGSLDAAILYFDAPSFAQTFTECTVQEISHALDILVAGYQYLAVELLARFNQKKHDGRIVFLLKTQTSLTDVSKSSSQRGSTMRPSGPIVAASQAAFGTFAENFAVLAAAQEYGSVVLTIGNTQNETAVKDGVLASWLSNYLKTLDGKPKPDANTAPSWVKAGARGSGIFSLFK